MHATELLLFFTLLQLAIIVLAARAGGALARRCGQTAVVGEIVVGILLGPSLFGVVAPETFAWVFRSSAPEPLSIMSQVGLLLLMFQIGLEFDFGHLREQRNRRAVLAVAVAGLLAPFALGIGYAVLAPDWLAGRPDRLGFALFVATAFSITAMPVLGRIMMEFEITRSKLGVIAISAAAITDVVGWLLLALVSALATSAFVPWSFALHLAGVLAFGAACWWIVRPPLARFVAAQMAVARGTVSPTLMGVVIAAIFLGGMATYQLGIFAIFGGFMMGVLLHRDLGFVQAWNDKVGGFVNVFFLPIFFTFTGLRTDIGSLASAEAWGWCVLLIALASIGKYGACRLAARFAGLDARESRIVAAMMNTRGLMELIVVNVGYELGVIGRDMFTMLVLMAIFSTVITSPLLARWLPQVGLGRAAKGEGARQAA